MKTLILILAAFFLCGVSAGQDIPMFRGSLEHTGVYHAPGAPAFHHIKWQFQTQGRVISSPAVFEDTAYVGSTDRNLYAVDLRTGQEKWKFVTGSWITSSPAVANSTVYFGSYDSTFYALDAGTGALKWKFQTSGEKRFAGTHLHGLAPDAESMPDPWDFYLSSPVVAGGIVYFGSGDGNLYALDAQSGTLKWKFQTGDVVHSSPAIANGTVFFGSWDSYLYALDAVSGREKWRFKTGEDPKIHNQVGIQSSPAVVDSVVYFGCRDSNLYAVDAATGQKKWAFSNHGSWVLNSPAVYDGKVFFGTSDTGLLHVVRADSGELITTISPKVPIYASPAIASGKLYLGLFDGRLTAIDLDSYKTSWTFETEASKRNAPGLRNPDGSFNFVLAFPDNFYDNMVIGVGKLLEAGSILSSPVIAGDVVYFGSADGSLYAVN